MLKFFCLIVGSLFALGAAASTLICNITGTNSNQKVSCLDFQKDAPCKFVTTDVGANLEWTQQFTFINPGRAYFQYSKNKVVAHMFISPNQNYSFTYPGETDIYNLACSF